jgi:hypothetical protein
LPYAGYHPWDASVTVPVDTTKAQALTHKDLTDPTNTFPDFGWVYLNSFTFGSSAQSSGAIAIAAKKRLLLLVNIIGFATADQPALRFNADSSAHYASRYITFATASTTPADSVNLSTSQLRLSGMPFIGPRGHVVEIMNLAGSIKPVTSRGATSAAAVATSPPVEVAGGGWWDDAAGNANQITQVELRGTAFNILSGSTITILGRN